MATTPTNWHTPASQNQNSLKIDKRLIGEYPSHLRGMATNRYGGNKLQNERGLRGGTYGAASTVRTFTEDQRKEYENELRERGDI